VDGQSFVHIIDATKREYVHESQSAHRLSTLHVSTKAIDKKKRKKAHRLIPESRLLHNLRLRRQLSHPSSRPQLRNLQRFALDLMRRQSRFTKVRNATIPIVLQERRLGAVGRRYWLYNSSGALFPSSADEEPG
jgi:hypothetical protein